MSNPMNSNGLSDRNRELVERQAAALDVWLSENAPYCCVDQKHLDADTPERAYWHYGRATAFRDILRLLDAARPSLSREEIARIIHPRAFRTVQDWRKETWCRDDADAQAEVDYYQPERSAALAKADAILSRLEGRGEG